VGTARRNHNDQTGVQHMPTPSSAWNAIMQYSFLRVFANDGTIDADELAMLEKLALEDGSGDPKERDVLSRVFARVTADSVSADVWQQICSFKERHQIP
jgi:hypothetical protein